MNWVQALPWASFSLPCDSQAPTWLPAYVREEGEAGMEGEHEEKPPREIFHHPQMGQESFSDNLASSFQGL
jgi:hypothetical protein